MREDELSQLPVPGPGDTIGPWLISEHLDWGSYGVVYRVQRAGHPEAGAFALKMARRAWDARFEREAELLQRLQHPSVPRFEEMGLWTSPSGHRFPYLVMELVDGLTLYEWAGDHPLTSAQVMRVFAQVAWALDAVHSAGAVHRDVKGDNIRVTPAGRAVLVDFGSGWLPGARPLTDTTAPPGTTPYRPPEMLRFMWRSERNPEARWQSRASDDLYSLGATAYRLVTGTYPPSMNEDEEPRKLLRPSELSTVEPLLEDIILRLLSADCEARGTARDTALALERAAEVAGPGAHQRIVPTPAAAPTEKGAPPLSQSSRSRSSHSARPSTESRHKRHTPRGPLPLWLSWASAAMFGGLVVASIAEWRRSPSSRREPAPLQVAEQFREEKPDAGTVGMADAGVDDRALASLHDTPIGGVLPVWIGREMPPAPFNGQRKPPCEPRMETTIRGGCWIEIGRMDAPCGAKAFDWEGRCYSPSFDAPRQPTSGEP